MKKLLLRDGYVLLCLKEICINLNIIEMNIRPKSQCKETMITPSRFRIKIIILLYHYASHMNESTLKKTILTLLTISPFFFACDSNSTKLGSCDELDVADQEMQLLVTEIEQTYAADIQFIKAFKESQVYWIQYRNRQLSALYPKSPDKYEYEVGTCKCEAYLQLTELRITELRRWTIGIPISEECPGSITKK